MQVKSWFLLNNIVHFHICNQLREYPELFGMALVDLYTDLTDTPRGQPPIPFPAPPAFESFQKMSKTHDGLKFADLGSVYNYLRGNKHLHIPASWKPFFPRTFETWWYWGSHSIVGQSFFNLMLALLSLWLLGPWIWLICWDPKWFLMDSGWFFTVFYCFFLWFFENNS